MKRVAITTCTIFVGENEVSEHSLVDAGQEMKLLFFA